MNHLTRLNRRVSQRLVTEMCRRIYRDRDRDAMPTAMVVGTGRSGTTWVAEIIDSQVPCRLIFEPFNPDQVDEFSAFHHFHYARSNEDNAALLAFCRALLRGDLRGRWVDGHLAHLTPRLRLIKDIRPTLMLRWLRDRFPDLPLVYVLRHPCAVVLSRMRLNWATDHDVQRFLCQPELVADYLGPYLDVIGRSRTIEEKHAIVWCISNVVPLREFGADDWTLVYYERLREQPETEVPRLFAGLGLEFAETVYPALRRPSRTTRHARASASRSNGSAWTRELTREQIARVLRVVGDFGLDHIYGDSATPLPNAPAGMRRHHVTRTGEALPS